MNCAEKHHYIYTRASRKFRRVVGVLATNCFKSHDNYLLFSHLRIFNVFQIYRSTYGPSSREVCTGITKKSK